MSKHTKSIEMRFLERGTATGVRSSKEKQTAFSKSTLFARRVLLINGAIWASAVERKDKGGESLLVSFFQLCQLLASALIQCCLCYPRQKHSGQCWECGENAIAVAVAATIRCCCELHSFHYQKIAVRCRLANDIELFSDIEEQQQQH